MKIKRTFKLEQKFNHECGQALVEYSFIQIMIVLVVLAVLVLLGPMISSLYQQVVTSVNGTDFSATAIRLGGEHSNDIVVTVKAERPVNLTLRDRQSGTTLSGSCSASCSYTISSVGELANTVEVSGNGVSIEVSYPHKN
jgi:Flp pilus assembly pilin Flp